MYIYKLVNTVNDKVYIGQTTKSLEERFRGHLSSAKTLDTKLYRAMRELGCDKFSIELVCEAKSKTELNDLEIYYIALYNSVENGYNMGYGGNINVMYSSEVKHKHLEVMRSKPIQDKISKSMKLYREKNPFTNEHRQRISQSMLGNHNFGNPDTRSIECYCIDKEGVQHSFHNYKIAGYWWWKTYNPFNNNYNYATFRRKIIDCIQTGRCQIRINGAYKIIDNIKWFKA